MSGYPVVSALKSVKKEVHNIIQILQLTESCNSRRFGREIISENDIIKKFRVLLRRLSGLEEFETNINSIQPFLDILVDSSTPGPICAAVLDSINKFVNYNLVENDTINSIACGLTNCKFQSAGSNANDVVHLKILNVIVNIIRSPSCDFVSDQNIWAMIKSTYQIGSSNTAGILLRSASEHTLQQIVLRIFALNDDQHFHFSRKRPTQLNTPRNSADEQTKQPLSPEPSSSEPKSKSSALNNAANQKGDSVVNQSGVFLHDRLNHSCGRIDVGSRCLKFLSFLISHGSQRSMRTAGSRSTEAYYSPNHSTKDPLMIELLNLVADNSSPEYDIEKRSLGLSLLNVALEIGGEEIGKHSDLVTVIQDHVCRSLLINAETGSLFVLSLTFRSIFNLFMYLKKHLKVQLEIFFNSFHLQGASSQVSTATANKRARLTLCEKRELALESLLEFCREPALITELYENYDCDVRCTNMFEDLVATLSACATPNLIRSRLPPAKSKSMTQLTLVEFHRNISRANVYESLLSGVQKLSNPTRKTLGRITAIERLAFASLCLICQNLAFRCVGDRREPFLGPHSTENEPANVKLEDLKRQRDYKKRLAAGARLFNADPFGCTKKLNDLSVLARPMTAESMADFLRTTAGLDLRVVGEYLAKPGDWYTQVRGSFVAKLNFAEMPVVEGLRLFLGSFRMPGEAQQIERVLESFAKEYFVQQPKAEFDVIDKTSGRERSQPRSNLYSPRQQPPPPPPFTYQQPPTSLNGNVDDKLDSTEEFGRRRVPDLQIPSPRESFAEGGTSVPLSSLDGAETIVAAGDQPSSAPDIFITQIITTNSPVPMPVHHKGGHSVPEVVVTSLQSRIPDQFSGMGADEIISHEVMIPGRETDVEKPVSENLEEIPLSNPPVESTSNLVPDIGRQLEEDTLSADEKVSRYVSFEGGTRSLESFATSDTVFVLSYSIIILNTDLHNSQVKKKMCLEDFVRNNRGINDGSDLSLNYLVSIYESIRKTEIQVVRGSMNLVGEREFSDYLVSRTDFMGDHYYSTTLSSSGGLRTELESYHHKIMFNILWEEGDIIETLMKIYISTRDCLTAVECAVCIGEIIRIAGFYGMTKVINDIGKIVLLLCQPIFTFKSQLMVPIVIHLIVNGGHDFDGWILNLEFIKWICLVRVTSTDLFYDQLPISNREMVIHSKIYGPNQHESPMVLENLVKLHHISSTTSWLSEIKNLFYTNPPVEVEAEPDDFLEAKNGSEGSVHPAEDLIENIDEEDSPDLDDHFKSLNTAIEFWMNCTYFTKPPDLQIKKPPNPIKTAAAALDVMHQIFNTRSPLNELLLNQIQNATNILDFAHALLIKIIPPSAMKLKTASELNLKSEGQSIGPSSELTQGQSIEPSSENLNSSELINRLSVLSMSNTSVPPIRYTFKRDDSPLLKGDSQAVSIFKLNSGPAIGLSLITQMLKMYDKKREDDPTMDDIFFKIFRPFCLVMEHLLSLYVDPDHSWTKIVGLAEKPMVELIVTPGDTEGEAIVAAIQKEVRREAEQSDLDAVFVERLVVSSLKVCLSLGHHKDFEIIGPLNRLYEIISGLGDKYFYRVFFQISTATTLLLNSSSHQGIQTMDAHLTLRQDTSDTQQNYKTDDRETARGIYAGQSVVDESVSATPEFRMKGFYLSVLHILQRASPVVVESRLSGEFGPAVSQSGAEILMNLAVSESFLAALKRLLKRSAGLTIEKQSGVYVPYVTRLLTQTLLSYIMPHRMADFSISIFDLEDGGGSLGSPLVSGGQTASVSEAALNLFLAIYHAAGATGGRDKIDNRGCDSSFTSDTEECENDDLWDLWAPFCQALAIVTAFGTKIQRRQAMMNLQNLLTAMPSNNDIQRWIEVIELILFPLMGQNFLYPFPIHHMVESVEVSGPSLLGQSLLTLFPRSRLVSCKVPYASLITNLTHPQKSGFATLPIRILAQRKSQSVGFVCRAILGKLDCLLQPIGWAYGSGENSPPKCLLPCVLRILRVFVHEMTNKNPGVFDSVSEGAKNFLLVVATSASLKNIEAEEYEAVLKHLMAQDMKTLVPVTNDETKKSVQNLDALQSHYYLACGDFLTSLEDWQKKFFMIVFYLLYIAERTEILLNVFDVLVLPGQKRM